MSLPAALLLIARSMATVLTDPSTGHTGLIGTLAAVPTIPGYSKVEGAMIPRQCQAGTIVQPGSASEVLAAIKEYTRRCKAAGGTLSVRASRQLYHASSDILCPEASSSRPRECSLVLDMEKLKAIKGLDTGARLVTTGPTLTFNVLMEYLAVKGFALDFQHLPFYSNLTVAGMLLTGAHGSSRTQPSAFGHIVASVTWIDALGNSHTTDNTELLIGSNGLWGIIVEMTMRIVPLTKLKAFPRRVHDLVLKATLQSILADKSLALIQWLPDVFQAIVMTRDPVPLWVPGRAEFQVLENHPLLATLGAPTIGINQLDNAHFGDLAPLDDVPICLAELVLIPYHRGEITKVPIPFGCPAVGRLPVMVSGDCIPGPSWGCFWRQIPINLLEVDLAVADLPAWMDDIRKVFAKEVPTCIPSVIEFAMRFGQSSNAPLDMAYGRDTVYVDIVSNKGPHQVDKPSSYQHVFDELEQLTFCKYKARPHWGKNSNRAFANERCPVIDKYPERQRVLDKAKEYDPDGIFVSPLIRRVLNRQSLPKTPGCAVRAECYCDTDEHCGPGYGCVPGETFPEYLVCRENHFSIKHQVEAAVKEAVVGRLVNRG